MAVYRYDPKRKSKKDDSVEKVVQEPAQEIEAPKKSRKRKKTQRKRKAGAAVQPKTSAVIQPDTSCTEDPADCPVENCNEDTECQEK